MAAGGIMIEGADGVQEPLPCGPQVVEYKINLGHQLRLARLAAEVTVEEVEDFLRWQGFRLSHYEDGLEVPDQVIQGQLIRLYRVEQDFFLPSIVNCFGGDLPQPDLDLIHASQNAAKIGVKSWSGLLKALDRLDWTPVEIARLLPMDTYHVSLWYDGDEGIEPEGQYQKKLLELYNLPKNFVFLKNQPSTLLSMGRRLTTARNQKGLSKARAVASLGCAVYLLSSWERGDRLPDLDYQCMLIRLYDLMPCFFRELDFSEKAFLQEEDEDEEQDDAEPEKDGEDIEPEIPEDIPPATAPPVIPGRSIGRKLLIARAAKSLSRDEVARRIKRSAGTISRWEANKAVPDLEAQKQLTALYDLDPDVFAPLREAGSLSSPRVASRNPPVISNPVPDWVGSIVQPAANGHIEPNLSQTETEDDFVTIFGEADKETQEWLLDLVAGISRPPPFQNDGERLQGFKMWQERRRKSSRERF